MRGPTTRKAVRLLSLAGLLWASTAGVAVVTAQPAAAAFEVRKLLEAPPSNWATTVRRERVRLADERRLPQALEVVQEALALADSGGQSRAPGVRSGLLLELAQAQKSLGRYTDAERSAREAVEGLRVAPAPDHPPLGSALRQWADMLRASGRHAEAMTALNEARQATLQREGPDSRELARTLNDRGELKMLAGDLDGALEDTEQALAIYRKGSSELNFDFTSIVHNLARVQRTRGDAARAAPLFEEAMAGLERIGGPELPEVAAVANNYGLLLTSTGDFEKARQLFERSVRIRESAFGPEHPETATGLNNLALLHWTIGSHATALQLYERVAAIDAKTLGPEHPFVATTVHNIASVLAGRGDAEGAWTRFGQALEMRRKAGGPDHPSVAGTLERMGSLQLQRGRTAEAVDLLSQSVLILTRRLGPDNSATAATSGQLAGALVSAGRPDQAISLLEQALPVNERSRNLNGLWRGQYALARAWRAKGESELAIYWAKESIGVLQDMRRGLAAFDRSVQRGFLDERRDVYVDVAGWLVDEGRIAESQDILRLLKEEEYFDFILRDVRLPLGAPVRFSGTAELGSHERLAQVRAQIESLSSNIAVLDRRLKATPSPETRQELERLNSRLSEVTKDYDAFLKQLSQRFARRTMAEPAVSIGVRPPHGVLRVQYLVSGQGILVYSATAAKTQVRRIELPSAELSRMVNRLRVAIEARLPAIDEGRLLYDRLLARTIEQHKDVVFSRIEVSLDGPLRYLPFAALHDGTAYLVQRYALRQRTEFPVGPTGSYQASRRTLDGFGLTLPQPGFSALPAVREELDRIGEQVAGARLHFDAAFNRTSLLDSFGRSPAMVHIASHFKFRPGTELDSYLLLGDGSRMSLRDIRTAPSPLAENVLVTLSACETALGGGRDETGREVEGLAATLLARGAGSVIATLWPVDDRRTAVLLPAVYREYLRNGFELHDALARAQIALLQSDPGGTPLPPFYWAAFVLMAGRDS